MEKFFVGQKVVRNNDSTPHWSEACNINNIDPLGPMTIYSIGYGDLLAFEELPKYGHFWNASKFEPFIEPAEASPAIVFTRAEDAFTPGCMVRRKAGYLDANWNKQVKNAGLDPRGVFKVLVKQSDMMTTSLLRIVSDKGHDLGRWGSAYFELVEQAPKADADGWIEWHGGKRPVDAGVRVDYRMADTSTCLIGEEAHHLLWEQVGKPYDIVAYRLHGNNHVNTTQRIDALERNIEEEINKRINAEREASEKIAKLESQLTDERQHRMKQEGLIERLRKILSTNGKEYKNAIEDRDTFRQLHTIESREASRLAGLLKSNDKIIQAMDVVVEQSRDNVKLALVLAASPEVSGDAVESLARLVRLDQNQQTNKIIGMISDRGVEQLPF